MIGGVRVRMSCLRLPYRAEIPLLSPCLLSYRHRCSRRLFGTSCSAASNTSKKEKVIVISGPTGAGESRLALELAKRLNGEIISADSVQVYRGLDVDSAKPSLSERKEVPHHFIDILHPSEDYSVGQFFSDARQATKDVLHSGHVPIIVGGTGLYLRWFMYGKPDVPKATREITSEVYLELADFERDGDWDAAVEFVTKAGDPSAQVLAANDWYRLRLKLEIIEWITFIGFSSAVDSFREQLDSHAMDSLDINSSVDRLQVNKLQNMDYHFLCFFLSTQRLDLYRSIDFRCEDMLIGNDGILSEARWLLDLGLPQLELLVIDKEQGGESSAGQFYHFLTSFQKASRNFAKRQITWFRNEHIYHWIDASKPLVPVSLRMKKDVSNRQESAELKAYRTRNRHFIGREDCLDVLEWIKKTQREPSLSAC